MFNDLFATTALVWLMRTTLVGSVWLGIGGLALALTREPARRTLLCSLTLAGSLLIPVVCLLVGEGTWGVGVVWNPARAAPPIPSPSTGIGAMEEVSLPPALTAAPESIVTPMPPAPTLSSSPASVAATLPDDPPSEPVMAIEGPEPLSPAPAPVIPSPLLPPAVTERLPAANARERPAIAAILLGAYFGGAGLFLLWYAAGLLGVRRLVRDAQAPPAPVQSLWTRVRGADLQDVPLRVSPRVPQPIACWSGGPCVLLPVSWSTVPAERLQWALAHEAEHIRRGDYWNWQIANLARCCYWFHPLAWWLRAELRQAQDYIADSAAARSRLPAAVADAGDREWGQATDYAEFLKASACTPVGRSPLVGLGLFGRKSHLYRRIAMLLQREGVIEPRPPRWWKVACITWGLGLFVTLTTLKVVSEPPLIATAEAATEGRPVAAVAPSPGQPGAGDVAGAGFAPTGMPGMESGATAPFVPGGPAGFPAMVAPARTLAPILVAGGRGQSVPGLDVGQPGVGPEGTSGPPSGGGGFSASSSAASPDVRPVAAVPTSVRKLDIENGFVSPEPGVKIGVVALSDPTAMSSWGMDGGAPLSQAAMMGSGMAAGGSGGMDMMMMPGAMGGPGMYGGGYGPAGPSVPEDHRRRDVEIYVQRPTPQGLSSSIDGQTGSTRSDSLTEPKVRRLVHTGYWPQEQMAGSVGVRFASQSVARDIASSNPKGESFSVAPAPMPDAIAAGTSSEDNPQKLAVLGAWWAGSDLSTRIPFRHAHPADFPFVLQAQATDVDGQTHPGRIESQPNQSAMMVGMGGMGGGMPMGAVPARPESWTIVFAHLPPSRIKSVRVTWHPYAWVIFRNVSLDSEQETKPTAELFIDGAVPPSLSTTTVQIPVRRDTALHVGDVVRVRVAFPESTGVGTATLFVAPLELVRRRPGGDVLSIVLERTVAEQFQIAQSKGEILVETAEPGATPDGRIDYGVINLLQQVPSKPVTAPAPFGSTGASPMSIDLGPSVGSSGAPTTSIPRGMRLVTIDTPDDGIERGDRVSIQVLYQAEGQDKKEILLSPVEVFARSAGANQVVVLLRAGSEADAVQLARRNGTVYLLKVEPDAANEAERKVNTELLKALEAADSPDASGSPATADPKPQPEGTTNPPATDARIRLAPAEDGLADPVTNEDGLRLI